MSDGFPIPEEFRKLLVLPFKLGGMSIINPTENVNDELNSKNITTQCQIKKSKIASVQLRRNVHGKRVNIFNFTAKTNIQ